MCSALQPGASRDDINAAYKRLQRANHPDTGGSTYLAAKINQARDLLAETLIREYALISSLKAPSPGAGAFARQLHAELLGRDSIKPRETCAEYVLALQLGLFG